MKIIKKLADKTADHMNHEGVTVVFLGDSVTQGCFENMSKVLAGMPGYLELEEKNGVKVYNILR